MGWVGKNPQMGSCQFHRGNDCLLSCWLIDPEFYKCFLFFLFEGKLKLNCITLPVKVH